VRRHHPIPHCTTKLPPQTASTLTFVIYLLLLHPEVLQRLRDEILEVVGPAERPTYEHVRDMKYLRAVLNGWSPSLVDDKSVFNLF